MMCAGFVSFENLPQSESNEAAREGTAAGEYLEWLLTRPGQELPVQASNGVYIDNDMRFYLKPLAGEILDKAEGKVLCEQRIDWKTRSGVFIRGQYDISFVHGGKLFIDDLKYGWGLVEVKDNWQLLGYAIGEVIRRGTYFEKIVLRIHQPRPHHEDGPTRVWELSYADLLGYKKQIDARFEEITNGMKTLQTGKHCKYCPAAGEACPAFNRLFYRGLEVSYEFTQDQITDQELALQLDQVSRAEEVLKIKKDSISELANQRIKAGKIIPGYITEQRLSDRSWKAGTSPEMIEALTGKRIVEEVMLSPAKAEKLGIPKEFIAQVVDRKFLGMKLKKADAGAVADKIFGNSQPTMKEG